MKAPARLQALWMTLVTALAVGHQRYREGSVNVNRNIWRDTRAQLDLSGPLAIVGIIIGATVTFIVMAALFETLEVNSRALITNFTTFDVGEDASTSIAPAFATVLGISILFGLVGIALSVFSGRFGGPRS